MQYAGIAPPFPFPHHPIPTIIAFLPAGADAGTDAVKHPSQSHTQTADKHAHTQIDKHARALLPGCQGGCSAAARRTQPGSRNRSHTLCGFTATPRHRHSDDRRTRRPLLLLPLTLPLLPPLVLLLPPMVSPVLVLLLPPLTGAGSSSVTRTHQLRTPATAAAMRCW